MKGISIMVDVESAYINTEGELCANIQIKQKQLGVRSVVINITKLLKEKPPK